MCRGLGRWPRCKTTNCDVERVQFVHLGYGPCPFLPVPAHDRSLMAILAQSDAGVLQTLFNVVSV